MDAAFWDMNVASPQNLDGSARAVPGQPFPMDGARASRLLRPQQLALLGTGFPLGLVPSVCPVPNRKDVGSFSLQSLLFQKQFSDCWVALKGQFRPKKLISSIKADLSAIGLELPTFENVTKTLMDKSLYSVALWSQYAVTSSTSLLWRIEGHGEKKGHCTKAMILHKLPSHDVTLEAAGPELFIDHKGQYWDLPLSISLDLSSVVSESGLKYHFGIHKNSGDAEPVNATNGEVPLGLLPGIYAKAAFAHEKSKEFWRPKETEEYIILTNDEDEGLEASYDMRLMKPHAAISGIIGGTCTAWLGSGQNKMAVESFGTEERAFKGVRSSLGADLFGSLCCTFQHGRFRTLYGDLTRVDARLDLSSASGLVKRVSHIFRNSTVDEDHSLSSPRLNLIFQQQIAGPIVCRFDTKILLDSSLGRSGPHVEDYICSLNYAVRVLGSGKVVAWYSPKRKEGMIELRLFEF